MKKIVAVLMCLMMVLSLFSCKLSEAQDDLASNDNTDSTDFNHDSTDDSITSPSEADIAMQTYEAVINDEICVVDEHLGEIKLKDCRFPSDNLRLAECEILSKAILDMDGDGINEYIIQSEAKDHIVLHYYNGNVYSYCFDNSNFYNLNTDGSFIGVILTNLKIGLAD